MKKPFLIVLLVFFSLSISAQQRWGGGVDYERIHFGFSFHYITSSFKVFKNSDWQDPYLSSDPNQGIPDSLSQILSPLKGGLGIGLLSDFRLGDNTNLRFSPTVLFGGKQMDFIYKEDVVPLSIAATLLELPLLFKFKSDRRKNYSMYLLGGGKYSRNLVPKKKTENSIEDDIKKKIKLKADFLSYEFGLGVDIYFEYFKMSPEIKWSQSLGDVLDKKEVNAFNTPIDKLLLRSIQFSLVFE